MENELIQYDEKLLARFNLTKEMAQGLLENGITLEEYADMMNEAVEDAIENSKLVMPRYNINGKHWQDRAGVLKTEIVGVVLDAKINRALFDRADKDNPKLLCRSDDGKNGATIPEEGEEPERRVCQTCPFNQFVLDQAGKRHRECKETRRIYFLERDAQIPSLIYLPPTSHKTWDTFASAVLGQGTPLSTREIKLTLEQRTEGSRTWGVIKPPEVVTVYTGIEAVHAIRRAKEMVAQLEAMHTAIVPESVEETA